MTYEQPVQGIQGRQERRERQGKKGIPEGEQLHRHQQPGQREKSGPQHHVQQVEQRQGQPEGSKQFRRWWSCRVERWDRREAVTRRSER